MDATEAAWTPLVDQARQLGPDPELMGLSDEQVERQVRDGAAQIAALTCRWLTHVAELVVRGVWAQDGVRTPGAWLSWRCGVASSTARQYVQVGLALRRLPLIRERFSEGTISYSKVRAICRVAAPQTQELLLELADKAPASHVERIVAACRRQVDDAQRWAEDGMGPQGELAVWDFSRRQVDPEVVEYRVRVPVEDAIGFDQRLDRLVDLADRAASAEPATDCAEPAAEDVGDGTVVPFVPVGVRRARAVCDALAAAVADAAPDRSGADDHLVVLHVDVDDLLATTAPASAETGDGPGPLASADTAAEGSARVPVVAGGRPMTLRRSVLAALTCDADLRIAGICTGNGDDDPDESQVAEHRHPADIGRRSRKVPPDLRRAVLLRDRHCRFPGCHRTRRLHAHHVIHWADGGPTDLDNLLALCAFHHRFVHRARWQLRPVDPRAGRWTFHRPDDPAPHPAAPSLEGASAETAASTALPDAPDPMALEPDWWDGDYDLSLTIEMVSHELRDLDPALPDPIPPPAWALTAA